MDLFIEVLRDFGLFLGMGIVFLGLTVLATYAVIEMFAPQKPGVKR